MKKLLLLLAALVLLTLPAAAVTITNPAYPGDTQAQAEMLKVLGLFRGTENGFELDRVLRRDEAAAMLVRFLGAEDKVLAGNWKHPFTDVPAWADTYVGWLYRSGLTKGVSATRYGAAQAVTCDQYCIFLSRAAMGEDAYQGVTASADEVTTCDKAGFTRGDAVELSVRTLSVIYSRYGNSITMGQFLIDKGAFTKEQLKTAAWDVLPREYTRSAERIGWGEPDTEPFPACVIAGVPVVRNTNAKSEQFLSDPDHAANRLYGTIQDGSKTVLYTLDPVTLEEAEIDRITAEGGAFAALVGAVGETDYLLLGDEVLIAYDGKQAVGTTLARRSGTIGFSNGYARGEGFLVIEAADGLRVIHEKGGKTVPTSAEEHVYALLGDRIVTQEVSADQTVIRSRDAADGQVLDSYTVRNDDPVNDEFRLHYAPALLNHNSMYLWGEAGLYRMQDGRLSQITARAALDYGYDSADGSIVLVSHEAGKRVPYSAYAVENLAGDEIVRLCMDGTEQMLLPGSPVHGMLIDKITFATGGRVEFTSLTPTEPRQMGSYTCALENGKVRVRSQTADITWIYGNNAWQAEQKRLDSLGVGAGS